MRALALGLVLLAPLAGCWSPVSELIATHKEPGGTVRASIDGGAEATTKGLGAGNADPMTVSGTSPALVFGLVVGEDQSGKAATVALRMANADLTLSIGNGWTTKLSVHTGGDGCAAVTATVHLTTNKDGDISGEFSGSGTRTSNGQPCQLAGTLSGIPVSYE